jgi:hypothetical protein
MDAPFSFHSSLLGRGPPSTLYDDPDNGPVTGGVDPLLPTGIRLELRLGGAGPFPPGI